MVMNLRLDSRNNINIVQNLSNSNSALQLEILIRISGTISLLKTAANGSNNSLG